MKVAVLGLFLYFIGAANANSNPGGQAAWYWHTSCGGNRLSIDVTLANKAVYHTEVAICRKLASQATLAKENDGLTFPLLPTQPIVFSGYRASSEFVPAGASLEMAIWQAGADPDTLTLGVSVADSKEIYVNTLFFAKPYAETSQEIGTGLVITTKPIKYKS